MRKRPSARIRLSSGILQVAVGQQSLGQRAKGDQSLFLFHYCLFETVVLYGSVEDRIAVLIDDEGDVHLGQDGRGPCHGRPVVVGQSQVEGLAAGDRLGQGAHGFFKRRVRVRAVVVEDVHIVKSQPFQTLVQSGQQMLA